MWIVNCMQLTLQKQTGCFDHSVVRQPLRKFPIPYHTTRILELVTTEEGVTPAYIKACACNNNHDLGDIVTTEHL